MWPVQLEPNPRPVEFHKGALQMLPNKRDKRDIPYSHTRVKIIQKQLSTRLFKGLLLPYPFAQPIDANRTNPSATVLHLHFLRIFWQKKTFIPRHPM